MKNSKKGISLIVLVITIIVIIILAAAVILTLNNNNPIEEANDARYASDVANMQAILTNTVAKIMAANQSTITIDETTIYDDTTTDADGLTEKIPYHLDYPRSITNTTGYIVFGTSSTNPTTVTEGEGENAVTKDLWYTGRALPNYTNGNEHWDVDAEGTIKLTDHKQNVYPNNGTATE